MKPSGPVYGRGPRAGPGSPAHGFRRCYLRALWANGCGLAASVATGWFVSEARGIELPVEPPVADGAGVYWLLLANNVRVLVALVAGALTLCIYTSLVLMWNGYFLGVGLASLRRAAPGLLPLAAPHVALEFAALLLGASAAWLLLLDCIGCLASNRPMRIRGIAAALAVALLLLLVAAWFEVRLIDGDFSPWDILFK